MNIFVAKLSPDTTSDDLQELFAEYGEVESVKVIMDRDTGKSKCYGFVEMPVDAEGYAAIGELNECTFMDSTIAVKKSKPKPEGGGRPRSGGGRDSRPRQGFKRY